MGRNQTWVRNWVSYVAARVGAMGLTLIDAETALGAATVVGRQLYRVDERHRVRAAGNIQRAFPEWSEARVQQVTRGSFEHLVQLVVEVLHLPRLINRDTWPRHLLLGDVASTIELLNAGRPVILLTGHVGNWEVLGYLMAVLGYPLDAIARPLNNPLIYEWLLDVRQRHGMRIITKWDATDRMLQTLNAGGALGFIADQNAGDKGVFVPFFGRLASTYKSIGLLAIRRNVPIVCGFAQRVSLRYQYVLGATDVIYPEDWKDRRDPLYYVTARYVRAIEQMVRQSPEQYLWSHRRWKSRPRHERLGRRMPASLRQNLRDLPWIGDQELEQLMAPGA